MTRIGNMKIKDSKIYVDVTDPRTADKPLIEVELPKELADEIFESLDQRLDSLPESNDVEQAFKRSKKQYFDNLKEQVNYD